MTCRPCSTTATSCACCRSIGKGAAQNTKDILYLRNTDMGITQSDILRHYSRTGEVGANIANRLRYITRLYNEEMHLLVAPGHQQRRGPARQEGQFQRRRQRHADFQPHHLRSAEGLKIVEVNMGQADAVEALKRGEIAATVLFGGKPAAVLRQDRALAPASTS